MELSAVADTELATMRAITQDVYGSVEVLRSDQIAVPEIEPDEVLVRVQAAGVDRGTVHLMTGKPYLMRILGFGFRGPKNKVPGFDLAGVVVSIGSSVTRFAVGDEVLGIGRGSFAEYAAAKEHKLILKPVAIDFEQAAAVAVSGLTAYQALHKTGRLEAGQKVLVIGASGGVGSYAVQFAKAHGAEVTGVASTAKLDLVRSLGADQVIDYTQEDFTEGAERYDLILDIGGDTPRKRIRRVLTPRGTIVFVGSEVEGALTGMGRQVRAALLSPFVRQRYAMMIAKEHYADLEHIAKLIETGQAVPSVERTYTLDEVPVAVAALAAGQVRGKVVIKVLDR